jgi:hypothetical protein
MTRNIFHMYSLRTKCCRTNLELLIYVVVLTMQLSYTVFTINISCADGKGKHHRTTFQIVTLFIRQQHGIQELAIVEKKWLNGAEIYKNLFIFFIDNQGFHT